MDRLTRDQAAVIGAFTGTLCGPMHDMTAYIARVLGRSFFTHEMATEQFTREVREASRADFMAICAEGSN